MKIKNNTEIQLMKILFKTSGKKPTKNITSQRAYPYGIEQKYFRQLQGYFKPLTDYVKKYLNENLPQILRGDSAGLHLDAIPGNAFDKMLYNLENWLSIYMPDISELPEDSNNNVIYTGLGKTADETIAFSEAQFKKIIEKGIHVNLPTTAEWWDKMKTSWMEDNYTLITSNAKNYISQINSIVEQGVVNGLGVDKVTKQIFEKTESLTKKHCKLLARDQMGKLNGQITQAQNEELGLDLYVWDTAMDDRVRDSHQLMQGLLCRWDDALVCSYDGGKTWVPRPSGAVDLHPGQDIQCRCSGLTYYPELIAEVENVGMEHIPYSELQSELGNIFESIPPVTDIVREMVADPRKQIVQYTNDLINNSDEKVAILLNKISKEQKDFVILDTTRDLSVYDSKLQKIILNSVNDTSTYRHELGHFLDHAVLGKNGQVVYDTGLVKKYRWSFSKSKQFEEIYIKELNNFVNKIKKEVKEKYNVKEIDKNQLKYYLISKGYSKRERLIIQDMFTAKEKKYFYAHSVNYYIDADRVKISKQFKNEKILSDGFAELFETEYSNELSSEFKKLIIDNFSNSVPIIDQMVNKYLGV